MSDEKKHARLSPSGAAGWMNCVGWESDSTGSKYSDEGTAAHSLASWCLTEFKPATAYLGRVIKAGKHEFVVDDEMAENVQVYVDRVLSFAGSITQAGEFVPIHQLLVEQAVPIGHITGEEDAEGTSDAIILTDDGEELQVHDLKYGMGERVDAEKNPQLMLYGLGALVISDLLGYALVQRVRCVIHQPRLNHVSGWVCTIEELQAFAREVADAAARKRGEPLPMSLEPGAMNLAGTPPLNPGEKQCRWCAKKAKCEALDAFVTEQIGADFEDMTESGVPSTAYPPATLGRKMAATNLVEDWCRAVRAEVEKRLFAGDEVEGYKLVEGKRGARAWSDATQAEEVCKSMRLKQEEMYTFKLISPTQAEKLLKGTPKRWTRLAELITQSDGKPSVAPISDKRPALVIGKTEDDFSDLTQA